MILYDEIHENTGYPGPVLNVLLQLRCSKPPILNIRFDVEQWLLPTVTCLQYYTRTKNNYLKMEKALEKIGEINLKPHTYVKMYILHLMCIIFLFIC